MFTFLKRSILALSFASERERDQWVARKLAALPSGIVLLDAGAGEQPYRKLCSRFRYVAQDFGEYRGDGNAVGLHPPHWNAPRADIVSDIAAIPAPEGTFDAVLCTEVLEHVPDPLATLRELHRVLKPGGTLLLTAPFASAAHQTPYHYATGFNRYFYETNLLLCGFHVKEIVPNGGFFRAMTGFLAMIPGGIARAIHSRVFRIVSVGVVLAFLVPLVLLIALINHMARKDIPDILTAGYFVEARKL